MSSRETWALPRIADWGLQARRTGARGGFFPRRAAPSAIGGDSDPAAHAPAGPAGWSLASSRHRVRREEAAPRRRRKRPAGAERRVVRRKGGRHMRPAAGPATCGLRAAAKPRWPRAEHRGAAGPALPTPQRPADQHSGRLPIQTSPPGVGPGLAGLAKAPPAKRLGSPAGSAGSPPRHDGGRRPAGGDRRDAWQRNPS